MATEDGLPPDFKNDRDASLKLIDWFKIDRVRAAKVMVVGAGAIGNEVLKNLALLGIGHIYIIDRDTIEISNLSRSILYRASDAGKLKAEVAARAVREINPNVKVIWQNGDIRLDVGLGLLRRMDVVISCLDNRQGRIAINRKCWKVDRPWIDAGIGVLNGQVTVFRPGVGGCYECSFTSEEYTEATMGCRQVASRYIQEGKVPTTPTMASLVAAIQVQEALKLLDPLRWEHRNLIGREFVFNGTKAEVAIFDLPLNEDCLAHSRIDSMTIIELDEHRAEDTTAARLLAQAREQLGPDAHLELNFDLVVERRCPSCKNVVRFLRPLACVYAEDLQCKRCEEPESKVEYEVVSTKNLGLAVTDYQEDFLDLPLRQLGIPPLDILRAYGEGGRQLNFELTGDAGRVLDFGPDDAVGP